MTDDDGNYYDTEHMMCAKCGKRDLKLWVMVGHHMFSIQVPFCLSCVVTEGSKDLWRPPAKEGSYLPKKDELLEMLENELMAMDLVGVNEARDHTKEFIEKKDELIRSIKDRKEELGIG